MKEHAKDLICPKCDEEHFTLQLIKTPIPHGESMIVTEAINYTCNNCGWQNNITLPSRLTATLDLAPYPIIENWIKIKSTNRTTRNYIDGVAVEPFTYKQPTKKPKH